MNWHFWRNKPMSEQQNTEFEQQQTAGEPSAQEVEAEPIESQESHQGTGSSEAAPAQADSRERELQDRLLRQAAEFDNFRKRTRKELLDSRTREREAVVREFLEILDNFERAFDAPGAEENAWLGGMRGVLLQFNSTLQRMGVKPIEALHQPYDPRLHEALGTAPNPELAEDIVCHVIQKGYLMGEETVLRPAKVMVVRNS